MILNFTEHLLRARGNWSKARKEYMRERKWRDPDWYAAWPNGLAEEIEIAAVALRPIFWPEISGKAAP